MVRQSERTVGKLVRAITRGLSLVNLPSKGLVVFGTITNKLPPKFAMPPAFPTTHFDEIHAIIVTARVANLCVQDTVPQKSGLSLLQNPSVQVSINDRLRIR